MHHSDCYDDEAPADAGEGRYVDPDGCSFAACPDCGEVPEYAR